MSGTVPVLSVVFMAVSCLFGFALPIFLLLYFRLKKHADIPPFFIGCAVMLVFAFILERIAHSVILSSPAGAVIQGNLWLYALYGGLMAGIFEETGRLIAFKTAYGKSMKNVRRLLERFCPDMSDNDIQEFIYVFFPFMFGIYPYTQATEKQREAMEKADVNFVHQSVYELTSICIRKLLGCGP